MPIITFMTDFGIMDNYVAIVKGALLTQNTDLNIIDISHNVNKHDIVQASYILKHAYPYFPKGTIHIVSVKERYSKDIQFVVVKHNEHFFIGPDNGIFSMLFDELPSEIYILDKGSDEVFPLPYVASKAVNYLLSEKSIEKIGIKQESVEIRFAIQPVLGKNHMRGTVILIDDFGNAIVNIKKELFESASDNRSFAIYVKQKSPITKLSEHYLSVNIGEVLALFNSAGYLEIGVSMGNASTLLDIRPEDTIQIDFYDKTK